MDLAIQRRKVVLHQAATVTRKTIPDQEDGSIDLLIQVADKIQDFFFAHGSFGQAEVEVPQRGTSGNGEVVPVELILEDRRDAALGPGTHSMQPLAEPAFVYEDDDSALVLGFFKGQMFSSSRGSPPRCAHGRGRSAADNSIPASAEESATPAPGDTSPRIVL